jgi:hypothetical protein
MNRSRLRQHAVQAIAAVSLGLGLVVLGVGVTHTQRAVWASASSAADAVTAAPTGGVFTPADFGWG